MKIVIIWIDKDIIKHTKITIKINNKNLSKNVWHQEWFIIMIHWKSVRDNFTKTLKNMELRWINWAFIADYKWRGGSDLDEGEMRVGLTPGGEIFSQWCVNPRQQHDDHQVQNWTRQTGDSPSLQTDRDRQAKTSKSSLEDVKSWLHLYKINLNKHCDVKLNSPGVHLVQIQRSSVHLWFRTCLA